ncbi:MAG: cupin domain-containing protein [Synechococcus sp.]
MTDNLYANIPSDLSTEVFDLLASGSGVKIERSISKGHTTPDNRWEEQKENAWVLVLRGEAVLEFGHGRSHRLVPGSYISIPARTRYRVDWTTPDEETIWLTVYY